jgi:hypothetical protein
VLERLFRVVAPPRVVYVSCNPEALATELPGIVDAGYAIEAVQPVDMFPHTPHIETVVTLRRAGTRRPHAGTSDRGAAPGAAGLGDNEGRHPRARRRR